MMRRLSVALRLAIVAALILPSVALASPTAPPITLLSEGFESDTTPSYVLTPFDSPPGSNGTLYGYWGPVTFRKYSGSTGLWCGGSKSDGTTYQQYSAGWASFDLSRTADYYDSDLSFMLTLPSRGSEDRESFAARWREVGEYPTLKYKHALTGVNQWRLVTYNLGGDYWAPLSRVPGELEFKWRDAVLSSENPRVGEGATIDDVTVTGWKYGPPRSVNGSVGASSVVLSWQRPWRSLAATSTEERPISYRIWGAPGGSTTWQEVTTSRLDLPGNSVSTSVPVAVEGQQYRYAVQAWDTGSGSGYGQHAETTVSIPIAPPTLSMASPAGGFPLTLAPVTISGTAADVGTGVSTVQVRVRRADGYCWNGLSWTTSDTWLTASQSGGWANWTYSWMPDEIVLAANQIVTVSARARDGAGQYSAVAASSSSLPLAASVALAGGAPVTTSSTINANLDATGSTHARYSVNGGAYSSWAPYSSTIPVVLGSGDGTKTVTFQFSTDGSTVAAISSDTILLHTTLPSVAIASPTSRFSLLEGAVAIAGSASDEGGSVSAVMLRIRRASGMCWNGTQWVSADTWLPAATSSGFASWSRSWTPDEEIQSSGEIVTIAARATDSFGLSRTTTAVASSVPVAASLSLADGASHTTSLDIAASLAATGSPIQMRYSVDGDAYRDWIAFSSEATVALPAGDGTKTVMFEVSNGETSVQASDSIVLHTSTPSLDVTSPVGGFPLYGVAAIAGTASDAGGTVEAVQVRLRRSDGWCWNGIEWVESDTWLAAAESSPGYADWLYLWDIDPTTIVAGKMVTASVRAVDAFGLTTESESISSSVPRATSITIAGGAPFSQSFSLPVTLFAEGANHMRYGVDGGAFSGWMPYAAETTVALSATGGERTLTFQFSDNGTRAFGTTSDSIVIDTVDPSGAIGLPAPGFPLVAGVNTVSGTASDATSGIESVLVRITRSGQSWNGIGWQDAEHWLPAAGAEDWSLAWSPGTADIAGYDPVSLTARVFDAAGNSAESAPVVSVDPLEPTRLSASVSATIIRYGASASISGTLTTSAGAAIAGRPVKLEYYSGGWKSAGTKNTSASGAVVFSVKPTNKTSYRLAFAQDVDYSAAPLVSSMTVTPRVYLTRPYKPYSAVKGRAFTSYGYLKPRHSAGSYPVRIYKQRYIGGGKWKSYGYVKARAYNYSSYTKYSASVSLPYTGTWRLRAYAPSDASHAATYSYYTSSFKVR